MDVWIIDNYDSFTYNLYQFIGEILTSARLRGEIGDFSVVVRRNDDVTLEQIRTAAPDRIIISPGPGSPDDERYFSVCAAVIREIGPSTPLLGVCLGMQGIVHVFGGRVIKAPLPMHGKISPLTHNGEGVFRNAPDGLEVMRYLSLIAESESLPDCLEVTAAVGDLPADAFVDQARIHAGASSRSWACGTATTRFRASSFTPSPLPPKAARS